MDRGTWWAAVQGVSESDIIEHSHTSQEKRGSGEEAGRGEHRQGPSEVGPAEQLAGQKRGRAVMLKSRAGWASEGAGKRGARCRSPWPHGWGPWRITSAESATSSLTTADLQTGGGQRLMEATPVCVCRCPPLRIKNWARRLICSAAALSACGFVYPFIS